MNLTDEKEQNQNVEAKYIDSEIGFDIIIKKDKLYKIKRKDHAKNAKIVKPVSADGFRGSESTFLDLDHLTTTPTYNSDVDDDFQGDIFIIEEYDFNDFDFEIIKDLEDTEELSYA